MASKKASRGTVKKIGLVAIPVALALRFMRMDESKKRFVKHLARQVPYLPGRYYA
jgi:hypothetical protein